MLANWRITRLNRLLQAGGVIAYPTEGVWGLAHHIPMRAPKQK